ncbi:Membrane protein involved in the export of O-antigen and teichoic acid [Halovenus aranensis]|uniref:Membrane protein involved in the export of O-antigen and teichoic acid n=2 Tax=Halovenus aranensis TaxID=890420 RepID=A0A1G8Z869_9EURY|nr:Membrane protein involved in the export of O-antigen and teichoic acid [Halovenus aranensis]
MILVNAGIFDGTRKYMIEDREDPFWKEHVFGFYFRVALILAVCASIGYGLFAWTEIPNTIFGDRFSTYFLVLSILIISDQVHSLTRGGLMGLHLESRSEPLKILRRMLFGLFGIALAALNYGVTGVLVGQIIASGVVALISLLVIFRRLNSREVIKGVPSDLPRREILSFNSLSVILILLTASLQHTDILLLRSIYNSQITGYYKAALVITEFLWFVPYALQTVLLHSSSELWSENKTEQITSLVARTTRYNLSLTVLLSLGLGALASDFVPLYFGSEFKSAIQPLLILLPGTLGFALARPIFAVGQGKGDLGKLIGATGFAAVMNLGLNVLLIPKYGMVGAAAATSVSYGSMLFFHIVAARSIGFNPVADVRMARVAGAAVVTAAIIFPLSMLIESGIISLLIVPPTGFVVYAVLTIKLGIVSRNELRTLADRLPISVSQYL